MPVKDKERYFLYLANAEHAENWLSGGPVPLFPSSNYKSEERNGVMTPDEVDDISALGFRSFDHNQKQAFFEKFRGNFHFENCTIASPIGNQIEFSGKYSNIEDDRLILSVSRVLSRRLMSKFGNKTQVLEICKPLELMEFIDEQLGVQGEFKHIEYTERFDRNCFLKAMEDCWQCEARFAWKVPDLKEYWVRVPIINVAPPFWGHEDDGFRWWRQFDYGHQDNAYRSLDKMF